MGVDFLAATFGLLFLIERAAPGKRLLSTLVIVVYAVIRNRGDLTVKLDVE